MSEWVEFPIVTIDCLFCDDKVSAADARAAHDLLDGHYRSEHPQEWDGAILHPHAPGFTRQTLDAITPAGLFGGAR